MRHYWWMFLVMIPVGAIVGGITAGAISLGMPKLFESEGIIEVTPPSQDDPAAKAVKPRRYSEQQLGKIADAEILGQVADGLDLPSTWKKGRDAALRTLKESVNCELIPDSNRISVRVRCGSKGDARDIAMGIIGCYRQRRLTPADPAQAKALADLNLQIDEQNERTSQSRTRIHYSKSTFGSPETLQGEAEFEANVRQLEELEKKLEVLAKSILPHLPTVTVHQIPELAEKPASPDIEWNLFAGRGTGMLISPLLAWPVMVVMNRRRPEGIKSSPQSPKPKRTVSPEDEW